VDLFLHPLFDRWLESLVGGEEGGGADWWQVRGEIAALLNALETHGRSLGDPECHEVVSARYDIHALRRTPRTDTTPFADAPPVLRILFGFVVDDTGLEAAVVLLGGDKTELGNRWYPPNLQHAQDRLDQWCRQNPGYRPIVRRGGL
jgi:hypothetical protein